MAKKAKDAAKGLRRLLELGYSQAQLARMFGVDAATISQWVRLKRVGAWRVARIEHIPELRGVLSISDLRPDLSARELEQSRGEAKVWARFCPTRPREIPYAIRTTRGTRNARATVSA